MRERSCSGYGRAIDLHFVSIAGWTATVVLGGDIQKASVGFLDWWIALFMLIFSPSFVCSFFFFSFYLPSDVRRLYFSLASMCHGDIWGSEHTGGSRTKAQMATWLLREQGFNHLTEGPVRASRLFETVGGKLSVA